MASLHHLIKSFVFVFVIAFLLCGSLSSHAKLTTPLPGEASDWKGYTKHDFNVDGRAAYVVAPKHAAPGNPWVWRARFPSFHAEADLILLDRGFHIAFINTNGMLGSDAALDHWDAFYKQLTQTHGLAKRPALEGVSRGGLFVYRWAARHPDKVACIYADTPVLDFKSWPLGQGEGKGHPPTWQNLLKQYGLTEEQALAWKKNPIDVLEPIAKAKIPLMHIVSLNDTIVPPKENTFVLAKRYRELGGSIDIIEVKEGTAKSTATTSPTPTRSALPTSSSATPASSRTDLIISRSVARWTIAGSSLSERKKARSSSWAGRSPSWRTAGGKRRATTCGSASLRPSSPSSTRAFLRPDRPSLRSA